MFTMLWNAEVTVPNLICSSLSCVATSLVLALWMLSNDPSKKKSLRYSLIMNLTVAEFVSSLNSSLSGIWILTNASWIPEGVACNLNGWIGHASIQAADFAILAISVVTYMTIRFDKRVADPSRMKIVLICLATWAVPLIIGTIALAAGKMEPTPSNWCWISTQPGYLRYVLGHAWKYSIFVVVITLYIIIFNQVRRRIRARSSAQQVSFPVAYGRTAGTSQADLSLRHAHHELIIGRPASADPTKHDEDKDIIKRPPPTRSTFCDDYDTDVKTKPVLRVIQSSRLDQETRHWFLLSMFPLTYILVWLPGLANRLAELTGHNFAWLSALQATTQLTGFVNALVYGFKEHRGVWSRLSD